MGRPAEARVVVIQLWWLELEVRDEWRWVLEVDVGVAVLRQDMMAVLLLQAFPAVDVREEVLRSFPEELIRKLPSIRHYFLKPL